MDSNLTNKSTVQLRLLGDVRLDSYSTARTCWPIFSRRFSDSTYRLAHSASPMRRLRSNTCTVRHDTQPQDASDTCQFVYTCRLASATKGVPS